MPAADPVPRTDMPLALTPLDESFAHQLVAPRSRTQHETPRWAERAYYLLHVDEGLTLNAGRQLYPHDGRWWVFAAAATGSVQHNLRAELPFTTGEDPDVARVGPLRMEVIEPLSVVRLVLEESGFPLSYDLTFRARFPAHAHEPTLIERDGEIVTHSMSFFQSGLFTGVVKLDGREWQIADRAGFRDRSWGFRKHDGSPGRGLVVFVSCETAGEVVHLLLLETASGRRAYTAGWITSPAGIQTLVAADHDLEFADGLLRGGRFVLEMADGSERVMTCEVENRLYLSGVGYSADPAVRQPGTSSFDLLDRDLVHRIDGQNDNGARFTLDGEPGHGYVETGLGTHARYKPEG
ncbi:MAG TPA: hypothetical protein VH061_14380 [Solirubrobacteraceae bacterium]|jgi:hypothetical protein|nr:hypothetical protein [Solirubrobacteraceae bacterium]